MGLAAVVPAHAQQRATPGRSCGTTENNEAMQLELERLNPAYNRNARPAPAAGFQRPAVATYRIPVVFHVVHNGEAVGTGSNISATRIQEQLDRLNVDYAKLNTDAGSVPAAFQPVHADVQVQFALAQRDPNGLCFDGIDRVDRNAKGWTAPPYTNTYCNSTIKPGSFWDPTKYMNFWVVDLGGGLLGFAQFPDNTANLSGLSASGGAANTDGVVCLYSAVGNTTGAYNLGRTATHEVGHYLGLRHIWGDAACGDDFVGDTPTQNTSNYGCPAYPHVTCTNGANGDQFMNYMDYVDDGCMLMFSQGQKDRVQAVMGAGTPRRSSLNTSSALPPAVTITASTSTPVVCSGSTIFLSGTAPTGYTFSWTGPNGFTSTQQNPSVTNTTVASSGAYTFTATPTGGCPVSAIVSVTVRALTATPTLAASNGGLSCGTAPIVLTATPTGSQTATLINQNWNTGTTEAGWTTDNTGSASPKAGAVWATVTPAAGGGIDGTRYIAVDATPTNNSALTRVSLKSPVFSATSVSSLTLTFQHIFVFAAGDLGKVEISNDGGTTWTTLASYSANTGTAAVPAAASISLNSYAGQPNLQLRWNYSSNSGQSWSVDNMLVTGTIVNTYAWSLVSGDGMPATASTTNTLQVSPSQTSVYQVTVTAPNLCASVGSNITITVPTAVTWNGSAGDGAWANPSNWNPCVPTRVSSATIPSGLATPYPTITTAAEVASLTQNGPLTLSAGSLSLYGDHTGTGAFTQTGGTFVVAGLGTQTLRGLAYGPLTLSGTGTKNLAANATATGAVTLSGGTLVTGASTLTLNGSATLVETPASYVLGRVASTSTLTAGSSSNFQGLGLTIAVAAGGVSPGSTTAMRVTGTRLTNPAVPAYQGISRYFDVTPTVNVGLNLTLTLSYNAAAELSGLTESRLVTFRALNTAGPFERMAGTLNMAAGTVTVPNVNHLSVWTLADANAPLPVELTTFTATAAGASVRLAWATASEKNSERFDVERSGDGRDFARLGTVAAAGSSSSAHSYGFVDNQLPAGAALLYYRLKQVDADGSFSYSPVRSVALGGKAAAEAGLTLFPNPARSAATLTGAVPGTVVTVFDALGRLVTSASADAAGTAALVLPAGQATGVYVVRAGAKALRLVVE